jgi:hypothetical protein
MRGFNQKTDRVLFPSSKTEVIIINIINRIFPFRKNRLFKNASFFGNNMKKFKIERESVPSSLTLVVCSHLEFGQMQVYDLESFT